MTTDASRARQVDVRGCCQAPAGPASRGRPPSSSCLGRDERTPTWPHLSCRAFPTDTFGLEQAAEGAGKDTVLLRAGLTIDILLDVTEGPGGTV